jgi:hypothetical protein
MRFTDDNTDGYTKADLAELNRRFEAKMGEFGDVSGDKFDQWRKSTEDWVAEQILAAYDNEIRLSERN